MYLVPQNLIEFWAVATRPVEANGLGWTVEQASAEVANLQARFEVLPENERIFEQWSKLVVTHQISGKRVHDARLAAQLAVHGVTDLLTFNEQDFKAFSWVTVLRPHDLMSVS